MCQPFLVLWLEIIENTFISWGMGDETLLHLLSLHDTKKRLYSWSYMFTSLSWSMTITRVVCEEMSIMTPEVCVVSVNLHLQKGLPCTS